MRRKKEPKPEVGQHRIVEVTYGDRSKAYRVDRYDWSWEFKDWQYVDTCSSMEKAISVISAAQDKQIVCTRVVWP